MITEVVVKNYRSIIDATVKLEPFTLLIGANGVGKSNFLRSLQEYSEFGIPIHKHLNLSDQEQIIRLTFNHERASEQIEIYSIDPAAIGDAEHLTPQPVVDTDGKGAVSVLDALKTGDREDLFDKIEDTLKRYVPEIEKLSFIPGQNTKQLQIREKHINEPIPLKELSDGTRLVLTILTIIYQENPPNVICLEEIDRALHPRLFQQVIELCVRITEETNIQIIATTHNPYLVDQFKDREKSVIIVEKEQGGTTFTPLTERLVLLESERDPLGELWYSGMLGGVPALGNGTSRQFRVDYKDNYDKTTNRH